MSASPRSSVPRQVTPEARSLAYGHNRSEFTALALAEWAECKGMVLDFIEPGRSIQNRFIERFNGSFRRGVFDMRVFHN
jgi:transposase InsO family protein